MTEQNKTLGALLKESFAIFTSNIVFLVKVTIAAYAPLLLLSVTFMAFLGEIIATKPSEATDPVMAVQWFLGGIAFFVVIFLLSLFYQIMVLKAVIMAERGEKGQVGALLRESWGLLNGYLYVVCWVAIKVLLWSLLFIIPGIIFSVLYSYASMAFVVDGQESRQALVYSKNVIRAGVGKFIGNMLVVGILVLPVYLIVNLVTGLVFGAEQGQAASLMPLIGSLLGGLMNAVVGIYFLIFSYLLYQELKKSMETKAPIPAAA